MDADVSDTSYGQASCLEIQVAAARCATSSLEDFRSAVPPNESPPNGLEPSLAAAGGAASGGHEGLEAVPREVGVRRSG